MEVCEMVWPWVDTNSNNVMLTQHGTLGKALSEYVSIGSKSLLDLFLTCELT